MTLLVERAAGAVQGRVQIALLPSATPAALGVAGTVSMSYRIELLSADDYPLTVQSGPALAAAYATGFVQEGGSTTWTADNPGAAINVPIRWSGSETRWHGRHTLTATQYVTSRLTVEAQAGTAATYAILRLSEFQVETGETVTGWTARARETNDLTISVRRPNGTPVWVLLAASPCARWEQKTVTNGAVTIVAQDDEAVRACAVFDTKLTAAEVGDALDALDPTEYMEYTRLAGVRRVVAPGANRTEMLGFFESVTDEYLTTGAQTTSGPGPGHSLMVATNRDQKRFEMRPNEVFSASAHTEIYPYGGAAAYDALCLPKESTHWVSYWLRYTGETPATWRILGQWHQSFQASYNNGRGFLEPIFSLGMMGNGDLTFDARVCLTAMPSASTSKPPISTKALRILQSRDGVSLLDRQWHHVLMKVLDKSDGTGTAEAWIDGIKASGNGGSSGLPEGTTIAPCGYNVTTGNLFQHGIYAGDNAHGIAEYASVQWGSTDLSAYVADPPPRA
ncbi:hypothetical protein [Microbacterium sp. NPDC056052]|uniref:hypothetical protein n=1 Tax=Microbacterium sp. NPDC056052 TaxID=3345695 RepID=UPI0035DD011F